MTIKQFHHLLVVLVGISVLLSACGETQDETPEAAETTTTSMVATPIDPDSATMPSVPSKNPNTAPETVVDKAILDLVKRTKVLPEAVTVVTAETVTWPDGSLGCPQPGVFYTQALVDGSRVLLETDGRLYAYHAGSDGVPFLCESDEGDGGYGWVPRPGFNT